MQRAHQNTLESAPSVAAQTMMVGLMHPVTAAALCGIWSVGRVAYVVGYERAIRRSPTRRDDCILGDIPLSVMTFVVGYKMVK